MIYLDMDGVLADFDRAAAQVLDTTDIHKWQYIYGAKEFWQRISAAPLFFQHLEPMPDAYKLLRRLVWHKGKGDITVLTALPSSNSAEVEQQKRNWVAYHLGDVPVICCKSSEKPEYCNCGDVLVDDRYINCERWREAGGIFILHHNADMTIHQLERKGII